MKGNTQTISSRLSMYKWLKILHPERIDRKTFTLAARMIQYSALSNHNTTTLEESTVSENLPSKWQITFIKNKQSRNHIYDNKSKKRTSYTREEGIITRHS